MTWSAVATTVCAGALIAALSPSELYAQNITQVQVRIKTSSNSSSLGIANAGTDGNVYLGLGGREFYLDRPLPDFDAGADELFVLGTSANVVNPSGSDPRSLTFNQAHGYPVYLRLSEIIDDDWTVDYVEVHIFSNNTPASFSWSALGSLNDNQRLRLGRTSGSLIYLTRTD
jgi:hypothetical protein